MNVLVAYASKYGATREIAQTIADILQKPKRLSVDLHAMSSNLVVTDYDAFIVGSAIYSGQWRPEAAAFLKAHEAVLAARPVWLFSSGPTGQGEPQKLLNGWQFLHNLQALSLFIQPHDIQLFHGHIDVEKLSWGELALIQAMGVTRGDFRDWEQITNWANRICRKLVTLDRLSEKVPAPHPKITQDLHS